MSNPTVPPPPPHIALLPSAGMGHLTPFIRIAAMLSSRNCIVSLITARPSVSAAESAHISFFLSQHPKVNHIEFQAISSPDPTTDDPFFVQFEATTRSVHLLYPLLAASSPPVSAIFSDFVVASTITPVAADLGVPNYIIFTGSCRFSCLMAYLPTLLSNPSCFATDLKEVNVPGIAPLPIGSIPPSYKNPNHLFTSLLITNSRAFSKSKGILMNTFEDFEPDTLAAINSGRVLENLPPFLPIGPLDTFEAKKEQDEDGNYLSWLDSQPAQSVVYVSFGSRTAMSNEQIKELANGLERSGYRFLWVLKTSKVDKDDKEDLKVLPGEPFLDRTKGRGVVMKGWHGDQSVNAEVVETAGLGIWERSWGLGLGGVVCGEAIGRKIVELMEDKKLRGLARKVGEDAKKATAIGGKSEKVLNEVLEYLMQKN
ncbi:unnamed protein product [Malus baccata var. baccata]